MIVKGAMDALKTDGLLGVLTGGIKNSAAGIATALVFGYVIALIFDPKSKA